MKRTIALLLAVLALLTACGAPADTTAGDGITDEPVVTDEPTVTDAPETEPLAPVERFDYTIPVFGDTFVQAGFPNDNFSTSAKIEVKNASNKLQRNGYLDRGAPFSAEKSQ